MLSPLGIQTQRMPTIHKLYHMLKLKKNHSPRRNSKTIELFVEKKNGQIFVTLV